MRVLVCAAVLAVFSFFLPARANAAPCGLADGTLWIDYDDFTFPGWPEFDHAGVIVSTSGGHINVSVRAGGGGVTYWDMHLWNHVGTTRAPADPATIDAAAGRVFDTAVAQTDCGTPLIGENELFGAQLPAPWSATNARYRANVLAYLQDLARRGARPFLFLSQDPETAGVTAAWWRQVAAVSDIVRETFLPVRKLAAEGPIAVSRFMRGQLRHEVRLLTAIGIPTARLGVLGEFEAGSAGRNGLPSAQWWELVKLQALAMKQVAGELALASVWSWGWGTFGSTDVDPDKPMTACVWLWARDPSLCDAPGVAGAALDTSLDEGQLTQIPIGAQCVWPGGKLEAGDVRALAATPSHPGVAEQLLLDQLLLQQQLAAQQLPDPAVAAAAVARSERAVVDDRFAGSQFRFLAALNRVGFSEADARLLLANQLRIRALERSVLAATVPAASLAGARTLLGSQPNRPVRLVRLLPLAGAPVPWWLGGRSGYALSGLAPARLFRLPAGQTVTLYTPDGDYQATAIAAARPVSELNAGQRARLALLLREALTRQARARAVAAWLARQEQQLFPAMLCVRDVLPAADGGKRLLRRATFLAISA